MTVVPLKIIVRLGIVVQVCQPRTIVSVERRRDPVRLALATLYDPVSRTKQQAGRDFCELCADL